MKTLLALILPLCLASTALAATPATAALADPIVVGPAPDTLPFTVAKDTTAITEPLNADGTVDYLGAWNQKFGENLPPDQNGFTLWLTITDKTNLDPGDPALAARMAGGTIADTQSALPLLALYVMNQKHLPPAASDQALQQLDRAVQGPCFAVLDLVQQIATGHRERYATLDPHKLLAAIDTASVDWDTVLRQINASVDEELQILAIPDPTARATAAAVRAHRLDQIPFDTLHSLAVNPGETRSEYTQRLADTLESRFVGSMNLSTDALQRRSWLAHDLARTLLAAGAFKARTGHWPQQLNDLVPTDLPEIPRDFANKPPTYTLTKNGPSLAATADDNSTLTLGAPLPPTTAPSP